MYHDAVLKGALLSPDWRGRQLRLRDEGGVASFRSSRNLTADGTRTFSSGDGWSFDGGQGALGHVIFSWKRANGHELRITVIDAVEGPYFVADQDQFA